MRSLAVRLHPGDDLKRGLDTLVRRRSLPAACVLSCAGSLDHAAIRFAGRETASRLDGPLEIVSLSGTLSSEGGSHLHIAVSDADGRTSGGHLKEGSQVRTTAEIVIGILPGIRFTRLPDHRTGHMELVIGDAPS